MSVGFTAATPPVGEARHDSYISPAKLAAQRRQLEQQQQRTPVSAQSPGRAFPASGSVSLAPQCRRLRQERELQVCRCLAIAVHLNRFMSGSATRLPLHAALLTSSLNLFHHLRFPLPAGRSAAADGTPGSAMSLPASPDDVAAASPQPLPTAPQQPQPAPEQQQLTRAAVQQQQRKQEAGGSGKPVSAMAALAALYAKEDAASSSGGSPRFVFVTLYLT